MLRIRTGALSIIRIDGKEPFDESNRTGLMGRYGEPAGLFLASPLLTKGPALRRRPAARPIG